MSRQERQLPKERLTLGARPVQGGPREAGDAAPEHLGISPVQRDAQLRLPTLNEAGTERARQGQGPANIADLPSASRQEGTGVPVPGTERRDHRRDQPEGHARRQGRVVPEQLVSPRLVQPN